MDRREFVVMATSTAAWAVAGGVAFGAPAGSVIDAGPVSDFAGEGVYSSYRALGFFVVRQKGKLFALSSICTHRKVQITAERDCSFYCKRHGSMFDAAGHVTEGPARRDLPVLSSMVNGSGHLLVTVPVA